MLISTSRILFKLRTKAPNQVPCFNDFIQTILEVNMKIAFQSKVVKGTADQGLHSVVFGVMSL
jgi:hypothetical protein